MSKRIIVIGGGISGLATLHYLLKQYHSDSGISVSLLEKNNCSGGTIQTIEQNGCLCECGPNGFLDSKPETLSLIEDLRITENLVRADDRASIRYILKDNRLHEVPTHLKAFLNSNLLSFSSKARVFAEMVMPKKQIARETVHAFGQRRLGRAFADIFLDAMISGVYAGDSKQTILKAAFPKMHGMEQKHGSLFRAMFSSARTKQGVMPKGRLTSFGKGMGVLTETLSAKHQEHIVYQQQVKGVKRHQEKYIVLTEGKEIEADQLFICAPSYAASQILSGLDREFSKCLKDIFYAPVAVVNLVFMKDSFDHQPEGFGYLIPSGEHQKTLGVLFEHNIFPGRCSDDQVMFRIMLGGARHPNITSCSEQELVQTAQDEMRKVFPFHISPQETFVKVWERAIPQYDERYMALLEKMGPFYETHKEIRLVANYLYGVGINDCIENASKAVLGQAYLTKEEEHDFSAGRR